jgi:nucleoside-diphosphate-sugar epimerase
VSIAYYSRRGQAHHLVAIVGLGLIGQAVAEQFKLQTIRSPQSNQNVTDWSNPQSLIDNLKQTLASNNAHHLELVWCAGKAGFSSEQAELSREHQFFRKLIASLSDELGDHLRINLISSAGGLYENSGRVTELESLSPSRPYAQAKLAQEQLLNELGVNYRIYRVSSVYGVGGSRMGLISVMLQSAVNRKPMVIHANQNTLRDYILNTDIARTIVDDVLTDAEFGIRILASGRATSVDMLLNMVHKIIGARPVYSFQASGQNNRDIVFSPRIVYCPSRVTSLEEGIRVMAKKIKNGGSFTKPIMTTAHH